MVAGLGNTLVRNGEVSESAGAFVALLMLTAGIITIVTHNQEKRAGTVIAAIMYLFAFHLGISNYGSYADLQIWSILCNIFWIILASSLIQKRITKVLFIIVFIILMIFEVGIANNNTKNSEEIIREKRDLENLHSAYANALTIYIDNNSATKGDNEFKDGDIFWYNPKTGHMLKTRTVCGVGTDEIGLGTSAYNTDINKKFHYDGSSTVGKGIKVTFANTQKSIEEIEPTDIDVRFE